MARILHIAAHKANPRAWTRPFVEGLREFGELHIITGGDDLSDEEAAAHIRGHDVLITSWGARATPATLAVDPGRLRYICHLTGAMGAYIPVELIESAIPVTYWGDAQARPVAEGAVLLLLASLKGLRERIDNVEAGHWNPPEQGFRSAMLWGLALGVYGFGFIGRTFVASILVVTYFLSLVTRTSIFAMGTWSFTGFAGLFPIIVAALFWRRSTKVGAFASLLTVTALWTYYFIQGWGQPDYSVGGTGVMPVAVIVTASALAMVAGSLLSRPPGDAILGKFFPA